MRDLLEWFLVELESFVLSVLKLFFFLVDMSLVGLGGLLGLCSDFVESPVPTLLIIFVLLIKLAVCIAIIRVFIWVVCGVDMSKLSWKQQVFVYLLVVVIVLYVFFFIDG